MLSGLTPSILFFFSLSECHLHPVFHIVLLASEMGSFRVIFTSPVETRLVKSAVALHGLGWEFFFPGSLFFRFTLDREMTLIGGYEATLIVGGLVALDAGVAVAKELLLTLVWVLLFLLDWMTEESFMSVVHDLIPRKLGLQPRL